MVLRVMAAAPEEGTTTLQAAAALYAEHHVAIFPVAPRGKLPLLPRCAEAERLQLAGEKLGEHAAQCAGFGHGFWDATADQGTVAEWWDANPSANIGIALGVNGLFVVDVDGPEGRAALDDLEQIYGDLPDTYKVITGREEGSGRHHVYRQPADGPTIRNGKLGHPKLEIRGDGGYVVAPPSIHESGRAYLAEGSWRQIADPPGWLVTLATRPQKPPATFAAPAPLAAGSGPQGRARARLAGLAGKVAMAEQGNRNDVLNWAAYQAGRMWGADVLSEDDAFAALVTAGLRAGLAERETRATVESGLLAGRQDPDHDAARDHGPAPPAPQGIPAAPVQGAPPSPLVTAALTKIRDGAAFILDTAAQIEPVWGSGSDVAWAAGEPCILTGPTGVGKTTVAHQVLDRLMGFTTEPLFGLPVTARAARVLYLACDRPAQIRRAFARRYGETDRQRLVDRLLVHDGYLPAMVDQAPGLLVELVTAVQADVLVVDSLKDVATELEKGPNAIAINQALQLVCQAGCEALVLHHQRKAQGDNKRPKTIDDLYGNTLIPSGAGSVLLLWGGPGDLAVELHHLKKPADEVGPLKLVHDHTAGRTRVDEEGKVDLLDLAIRERGLTVATAARALYATTSPTRNEVEKARRQLELATGRGVLKRVDSDTPGSGTKTARYYAIGTAQEVPL